MIPTILSRCACRCLVLLLSLFVRRDGPERKPKRRPPRRPGTRPCARSCLTTLIRRRVRLPSPPLACSGLRLARSARCFFCGRRRRRRRGHLLPSVACTRRLHKGHRGCRGSFQHMQMMGGMQSTTIQSLAPKQQEIAGARRRGGFRSSLDRR